MNLRVYMIYDKPVEFSIDGRAPSHITPMQIYFFHAETGARTFNAVDPDGESATAQVALRDDDLASSRDRSWWCITVARLKDSQKLSVLPMSRDDCQKMADRAPADDVPAGL